MRTRRLPSPVARGEPESGVESRSRSGPEPGAEQPSRAGAHDGRPRAAKPLPLRELAAAARGEFERLTGRKVDGVAGIERDGDGYLISFEVVEVERIPESTNLMGRYEALVDGAGQVIEFVRTARYHRNQADEAGE